MRRVQGWIVAVSCSLLMAGCGLLSLGYFGYSMIANGAPVPLIEAIAVLTFVAFSALIAFAARQVWPKLPVAVLGAITVVLATIALWFYFTNWSGVALKQVYVIHLMFALALGTSERTVRRDWEKARLLLAQVLLD